MSDRVEKPSKRRESLRLIFNKHKYENEYGNRVGYRIEDVMSNVEEYMDTQHNQTLDEMQLLQERNEILESECANWKGELNQTLEDIKGEIEEAEIVDGGYTGLISLSDTLAIIDKAKG